MVHIQRTIALNKQTLFVTNHRAFSGAFTSQFCILTLRWFAIERENLTLSGICVKKRFMLVANTVEKTYGTFGCTDAGRDTKSVRFIVGKNPNSHYPG